MRKHLLLALTLSLSLLGASAQDKTVDQAARDPQRPVNSAKADLYIQDKTKISDEAPAKKTAAKPRKKKSCGACCGHKKNPAQ